MLKCSVYKKKDKKQLHKIYRKILNLNCSQIAVSDEATLYENMEI